MMHPTLCCDRSQGRTTTTAPAGGSQGGRCHDHCCNLSSESTGDGWMVDTHPFHALHHYKFPAECSQFIMPHVFVIITHTPLTFPGPPGHNDPGARRRRHWATFLLPLPRLNRKGSYNHAQRIYSVRDCTQNHTSKRTSHSPLPIEQSAQIKPCHHCLPFNLTRMNLYRHLTHDVPARDSRALKRKRFRSPIHFCPSLHHCHSLSFHDVRVCPRTSITSGLVLLGSYLFNPAPKPEVGILPPGKQDP